MIVMVPVKHCCDVVYKTDISHRVNTERPQSANVHTHSHHMGRALVVNSVSIICLYNYLLDNVKYQNKML